MKSYLTYITEVDKGPKFGQSSPDGGDADRFKITNYLDKNKKKNPLKDAMDSLDAQRSASPDNRPPGTPKTTSRTTRMEVLPCTRTVLHRGLPCVLRSPQVQR